MRRVAAALILGAMVAAAGPVGAETADAARARAYQMVNAGDAAGGLALAEALLAADPGDAGALIVKSRALRALGRLAEAEAAGRAAFRAAEGPAAKYGAAVNLAQALAWQGQRTRAQLWLRQAARWASTPEQAEKVASDYAYVRSQNPLTLRFSANVTPSDNVNGGASQATVLIGGVPFTLTPDALALSGVMADVSAEARWRLGQSAAGDQSLSLRFTDHEVALSDAARADVPWAENGDYRQTGVTLGYDQRDKIGAALLTTSLSLGRTWSGAAERIAGPACTNPAVPNCLGQWGALSDRVAARVDLQWPHGAAGGVDFAHLGLDATAAQAASVSDVQGVELGYGAVRPLGSGQGRAELVLRRALSRDVEDDSTAATLSLGWTDGTTRGGVIWGASLDLTREIWAESPYAADGRQDWAVSAGISADVAGLAIYGFSPVVSLTARQTDSSVGLYDSDSLALGVTFKSRF